MLQIVFNQYNILVDHSQSYIQLHVLW